MVFHRGLVPSPPPRPPEEVPQSRRGLRTVGDVGRAGLNEDCLETAATSEMWRQRHRLPWKWPKLERGACLRNHPPALSDPTESPWSRWWPRHRASKRRATRGRACSPWSTARRNRTTVPKTTVRPKVRPAQMSPPKVGKKSHKAPPSNQPSKPAANQRFTAEGASRRRLFQQGTRTPAFVEHPVVLHDLGGDAALFDKLGPWHRSQLLANAVGAIRSVRPLPSGKWLIGCSSEAQQSKLARLETLPGGVPIGAHVPRPVVDGVVGPIPKGGNELQLVRQDLEAGGHRVAAVTRLNNKHNEPSLASRISLEATELPTQVWLGSTPYNVQAYAAPVRRCTKCQSLGHTKQQCRARQGRCSKCGKNSHTHDKCDAATMFCVNCNGRHSAAYKGYPEMLIRQRANTLRSRTYLPYTVAMQRAREELKPRVQESDQPAAKPVDDCWSGPAVVHRLGGRLTRVTGSKPPCPSPLVLVPREPTLA